MSFFVIEAILIAVSIILAKKMVANRTGFAKKMIIGKDSDDDIQKMKQLAEKLLSKEITDPELDGLTINVEIKEGRIVKANVESNKTTVTSSNENGTNDSNRAFSERGAVAYTAVAIWGIAFWLHIVIGLAVEIFTLSQVLPQ